MKKFMARLCKPIDDFRKRRMFLTPAENRRHAQAQLDVVNAGLAEQRQQLRNAITELAAERIKTTHNLFEVKLTINRKAMETCVGEQAAIEIAMVVAKKIVEKHRSLTED
jgi:hypothetical protein